MSRTRMAVVLVIVGAAILLAIAAAKNDNPVDELEKKVVALQERVDSMEKQLQALRVQVAQGAAAGTNTQALEAEAQKAYGEIAGMINAGKIDEAKTRLDADRKKYARTRLARQFVTMATELDIVGKTTPSNWGIEKWFQGENQIDLKSDKPTLVVFWEEWCPHCRREVPKLEQMYESYKDKGLQLVGLTKVTKSATDEKVEKFLADQKVAYPVAKEDGQASQYFGVQGIPAAAVVKNGKVVWRGHPARITEQQIQAWL